MRPRPSLTSIIAILALVIACSGTSFAAGRLSKNSVGTPQLKKSAVTAPKLARSAVTGRKLHADAVTGAKVASDTLTGADVAESSLVAGTDSTFYPVSAFRPIFDDTSFVTNVGCLRTNGTSAEFVTPVDLPDGAQITLVRASVIDNDSGAGDDVQITLVRVQPGDFGVNVGSDSSSGATPGLRYVTFEPVSPVVGGDDDFFDLSVRIGDDSTLCGVEVTTTGGSPFG